jgi:hypothetical protein
MRETTCSRSRSATRSFIAEHRARWAVMFSRPFAVFRPAPEESVAGSAVRELIISAVRRATESQQLHGDPIDIAHAYVALIHGSLRPKVPSAWAAPPGRSSAVGRLRSGACSQGLLFESAGV